MSTDLQTLNQKVDSLRPDRAAIQAAAEILQRGGLVAFPTETVYGLGANALDPEAIASVYRAKGRPSNNPLIVHIPDLDAARRLTSAWPEAAERLAARFWPGPLTMVLPKAASIPEIVTGGGPTVGLRMPAHPVALALLNATGLPIAGPSANRSESLSPTSADHVLAGLDGRIEMVLDGGSCPGGIESTVLAIEEQGARLLRPGLISPAELEAVIGPILRGGGATSGALPSPGMMPRHYAPNARLFLASDNGRRLAEESAQAGFRTGWLTFEAADGIDGVESVLLPADPKGFAAGLYAALHRLDGLGCARIVVSRLPEDDSWLAIRDRLTRAAAPPHR